MASSSPDRMLELARHRHALAAWATANRIACEVEATLLRAELKHLRGERRAPSPLLRARASQLRELANSLRDRSVIDFVREPVPVRSEGLVPPQWPRPRARSSARSTLPAPSPERAELAEDLTL